MVIDVTWLMWYGTI